MTITLTIPDLLAPTPRRVRQLDEWRRLVRPLVGPALLVVAEAIFPEIGLVAALIPVLAPIVAPDATARS